MILKLSLTVLLLYATSPRTRRRSARCMKSWKRVQKAVSTIRRFLRKRSLYLIQQSKAIHPMKRMTNKTFRYMGC